MALKDLAAAIAAVTDRASPLAYIRALNDSNAAAKAIAAVTDQVAPLASIHAALDQAPLVSMAAAISEITARYMRLAEGLAELCVKLSEGELQ